MNHIKIQEWKSLIGKAKTKQVIEEIIKEDTSIFRNEIIILSNRWTNYENNFIKNILSESELNKERNQINDSLLNLLSSIESQNIKKIVVKKDNFQDNIIYFQKCFIIMPFNERYSGVWEAIIKPTVESLGKECIIADSIFTPTSILNDILESIRLADFIIADLSEQNPNVYYELGYAHALGKKVILITQNIANLPFDLRHQRTIIYEDTAKGALNLSQQLIKFINNLA